MHPVSRITSEGRAEFSRACGPGFEQEGAGGGNGRGNSICARNTNYRYTWYVLFHIDMCSWSCMDIDTLRVVCKGID